MTQSRISYTVYVRDQNGWRSRGQSEDMHQAIRAAEKLFDSKKFLNVKVDKYFVDSQNNRKITATILEKGVKINKKLNLSLLFAFALVGGLASFVVTYFLFR